MYLACTREHGGAPFSIDLTHSLAGYGSVILMLLVYFLWENGPHHASHKREIIYLFFVILALTVTVYVIEFESDKSSLTRDLTDQEKNIKYLEYTVLVYVVNHVFLDSIPSTPNVLEGISYKNVNVPSSIVRKVKDIEVMIVELHESGRAAFKRMQISNHALAPLYLIIFGVVRTIMESSESFSR